mmetsp:Transcript_35395/g.80860  ORF Transcript_35395/g.80860 Transcript_35395/m.80860 type:complete len:128 (-) Transcript_35395:46-429(-)|eukprot:CAMPEP_0114543032 /NCGR_PEP_ID=MMETSP0114-20121206/2143_1 /TAXON_ID=31324 /ORGANISM="Goniomonas sp, Strain m" /LENGTH=127 /DNA_ID=CAMNT_0001727351 /DNA_START=81 /DNA_END=464 /DNA_ORIENTATION=+
MADERANVEEVILRTYVQGAFNKIDPAAMREGFHEDFAIFTAGSDGQIVKKTIDTWCTEKQAKLSDPTFKQEEYQWTHNFASIDVTGGCAVAKVELSQHGKLVFTDYLTLLKFPAGWRIVAKVYHMP